MGFFFKLRHLYIATIWVILNSILQVAQVSCFFAKLLSWVQYSMVNIAKLFLYQNAAKLLKYCQVSRGMWSRQFF